MREILFKAKKKDSGEWVEGGYFSEPYEDAARFVLSGEGLIVDFDNYWAYEVEVIGNIFDNADLLEVE